MARVHMEQQQWKIFAYAHEAWESMLDDCRGATASIDLEQYIFEHDAIGKRFADTLEQKAGEGVRVRLLCDMAGSYNFFNSTYAKRLIANGVEVLFFNPIKPWRINNYSSWFFRDHRKVLVIDSRIGHIGGVGIHQRMQGWRDTHVRIEGSVVRELGDVFEQMWVRAHEGKKFKLDSAFRRADDVQLRRSGFARHFYFLTNSPRFHRRFIYHSLLDTIRNSRKRIYLTTPYFVPDLRLVRALRFAARRGVDVRLIVSMASDLPFVDIATRSYFWIMLKAGVRIYLYRDHVLHAKVSITDDDWVSVGSANLDNLSLLLNYEANLVSTDRSFVQRMIDQFNKDLERSSEVFFDAWKRRSWIQKVLEVIMWPIHKFL